MNEDASRENPKPPTVDGLSRLWQRINEHKIVQWSVAYVAVAYAIQHGVTLTSEAFDWPHAVIRVSMLLLALGLPLVMTFAWYHGARASGNFSRAELTIVSMLLVVGSLVFYVFVQPSLEKAAGALPTVRHAGVASGTPSAAQSGISVAVLPFVNLSSDKEQEFFSDGMTEEITAALAQIKDLRVVGRTSAFAFKGQNKDLRSIAQALGASHVIEGSVRKAGNRLRITAQLIKADDDSHLWAQNYDRELNDVFAIQEDIAQAIATSLQVPLGLKQGETLVSNRAIDPDSYQNYLRAKALVRGRGLKPLIDAATLLEQVVARDPNYAPAWGLLAEAYVLIPDYDPAAFSGPAGDLRKLADSFLPKAEAAGRKAIQLDAKLADGYSALAAVQDARGKSSAADDLFKQALAVDPNNPDTLHFYSLMLIEAGREKDALAMRRRLAVLEPFVPVFNWNTALALSLTGQEDAAMAMYKDLPPDAPAFGRIVFAEIFATAGHFREAADIVEAIPAGTFMPGMVQAAARLLRTAPANTGAPQSLPRLDGLGWVYPLVGASDRMLDYYERNVEAGYSFGRPEMGSIWHSSSGAVRKTERFKNFARKAGYVEYWRSKNWPDLCHPTSSDDFECN